MQCRVEICDKFMSHFTYKAGEKRGVGLEKEPIDLEPEKGGRDIYKIRMLIGSKESDLKGFLMRNRVQGIRE